MLIWGFLDAFMRADLDFFDAKNPSPSEEDCHFPQ
jgi:hypothetical protein